MAETVRVVKLFCFNTHISICSSTFTDEMGKPNARSAI